MPLGSEIHFLYLLDQGEDLFALLSVASLGNTLGGMTCFYIAKIGGRHLVKKYFKYKEERIEYWESKLKNKGEFVALLCWLPIIGEVIASVIGLLSLNSKKVFMYMLIGKLGRYFSIVFLSKLLIY